MRRSRERRRGFTLIELLIVIAILGLLIGIALPVYSAIQRSGQERSTQATLQRVKSAIEQYYNLMGDYPPSSPADIPDPEVRKALSANDLNTGIEVLVLSLFAKSYEGGRDEENLRNSDEDVTAQSVTVFGRGDLFEYVDYWGNPLVYIHSRDYRKSFEYLFVEGETGFPSAAAVQAKVSDTTGSFYNLDSYQLFSVGLDGVFGTEDDLHVWDR